MITFLAWFTVIGLPIAAILLLIHFLRKLTIKNPYEAYKPIWNRPMWQSTESKTTTYAHTDPPAGHVEPETTITTTCPEVTSIDTEGFNSIEDEVVDCRKLVDPGKRVYRIYRSDDHVQWSECEPALTERAACNYAQYMKLANPNQFVICKDPDGLILFYE